MKPLQLFLSSLFVSLAAVAQVGPAGTLSGTGAGSGLGTTAVNSASFNTPSLYQNYPNLNADVVPPDAYINQGIYPDPQNMNTSPNPVPRLSPSGQIEDATTLGNIPGEGTRRQSEEERPVRNPNDFGTTPDGRPVGPGVK